MVENVLLVTVDSLRYDHLSVYGYERGQDATLSALAAEGTVFQRAFATGPGTTSSFPALLTGTYPLSYGGLGPLVSDRPSVSAELSASGYQTAGFHSNPFLSTHFNYDVGFDEFKDYQHPLMGVATKVFPRGIELNNPYLQRLDDAIDVTGKLKAGYRAVVGKPRPYVGAGTITDDAIGFLESVDGPFFSWVHYMDVHHPCHPPAEYRRKFGVEDVDAAEVSDLYSRLIQEPETLTDDNVDTLVKLYDAAICYVDAQLARLLETLEARGKLEETIVIVTSDHGELFGEYDEFGKPPRMYDELIRIPLVIRDPTDTFDGLAHILLSLVDIPPLVHEALGLEVPDTYEGKQTDEFPREYVLAEHAIDDEVIVGARTDEAVFEVDQYRDETRAFEIRSNEFRSVDVDSPTVELARKAVDWRLQSLDVEGYNLESDVEADLEERLSDLGYL